MNVLAPFVALRKLLEKRIAVCTHWFPITSAYQWQGEIKDKQEVVLIVKTNGGLREAIEKVIFRYINYTNTVAELDVHSINKSFLKWLDAEVPEA